MNRTSIQWTTFSANPLKYRRKSDGKVVWACVKCSPGCAHCYSEGIALRFERGKLYTAANMEEVEPFLDEKELRRMLTCKSVGGVAVDGSRCFVGDMTDLFGEWVPDELLDRLFAVFALRPDVTWQVLTKRSERMADYLTTLGRHNTLELAADALLPGKGHPSFGGKHMLPSLPLPNVWLGVSVENQESADSRIPHLLRTPAAVRFLSCEPLLGAVDLSPWFRCDCPRDYPPPDGPHNRWCPAAADSYLPRLHWVIVGGESGSAARPCELSWVRSIVGQCRQAGVPVFVKQLGYRASDPENGIAGRGLVVPEEAAPLISLRLRDGHGGEMSEWPEGLRVREFPGVEA